MQWCTEAMTEERRQAPDGDRLAGLDRPLRNRVTPAGELIATEHRGTMYGNRGVLHNENLALVRRYQVRRWLVCVLEFRGRRRPVLRPRRYTELFFLDEATGLAAGHRPCGECRYRDYQAFKRAWAGAFGGGGPGVAEIDARLHADRLVRPGVRRSYSASLSSLPDGVMVSVGDTPSLVWGGGLLAWTPGGYRSSGQSPAEDTVTVITPRATVAVLAAGYRPVIHPSAVSAGG